MHNILKALANKKRIIFICLFLFLVLLASLLLSNSLSKKSSDKKASNYVFGYHALKVNGKFVKTDIFRDENNIFFEKWKTNSEMIQKSDEEINNLVLEEVIKRVLSDDYFYNKSGNKVNREEIEAYYNKYVKPSEALSGEDDAVNNGLDYKTEAELKKEVELYLLKLKSIDNMVKAYGITISEQELEQRYKDYTGQFKNNTGLIHPKDEYRNMLLLEKFYKSDKYNLWIKNLKQKAKIEITDPAMKAYRLYKSGRYELAAKEYDRAYDKYKISFYLERKKDCEKKQKK